jgi:malonyl-CoA O-methyltransferase
VNRAAGIGSIYWLTMETPERDERDPRDQPDLRSTRRPLDTAALARVARRLNRAATPPWLHGEVARRMVERLPIVKLQPSSVIDWGSFVGASSALLRVAYPQAQLIAVEPDAARRDATAAALALPWWSPARWSAKGSLALTPAEVGAGQGQLLWANMVLHGTADPQAEMQRWQRALAVDGFLMFATLGPGTLGGLRTLYAQQGWPQPFAPFVDMHDLGDMLLHAGFADPVMDQEQITLTWPTAEAALAELRSLGGNVALARSMGLRTPRWRDELIGQLQAVCGRGGRIALDFEVVYGHAFRPAPRPRLAAETAVPLDDLRAMVRAGRPPR